MLWYFAPNCLRALLATLTLGTNFKLALKSAHILYVYTNDLFQFKAYSDEYWECAVRQFTYPMYHEAGTCPMGPDSDPKLSTCPSWCTVLWVWYLSHWTWLRPKGRYFSYPMYHESGTCHMGPYSDPKVSTCPTWCTIMQCSVNQAKIWLSFLKQVWTHAVVIWQIFDTKGCNLTDIWHVGL